MKTVQEMRDCVAHYAEHMSPKRQDIHVWVCYHNENDDVYIVSYNKQREDDDRLVICSSEFLESGLPSSDNWFSHSKWEGDLENDYSDERNGLLKVVYRGITKYENLPEHLRG